MEQDYFKSLELETVSEKDIESMKELKLLYSIVNYQNQSLGFKKEYYERYMRALLLNKKSFKEDILPDTILKLDELKEKVDGIRERNQKMLDNLVEVVIMNLAKSFEKDDTDEIICARIFQYVTRNIKYSEDLRDYEYTIPFANDYKFECYNGIPLGKEFEDVLITKEGTSFEIATLMTFLGKVFGVDIKTAIAERDGKGFYINVVNIGDKLSYMDATSTIITKGKSSSCLVSKTILEKNGITFNPNKQEFDEGVEIKVNIRRASNIDKAISRERNELIEKARFIKENYSINENTK